MKVRRFGGIFCTIGLLLALICQLGGPMVAGAEAPMQVIAPVAPAAAWQIETVDGYSLTRSSIALDGAGRPQMAYYRPSAGLYYAWRDGATWQRELLALQGSDPSVVVDTSGQPHVSYQGWSPASHLVYAYRDGGAWQRQTVDNSGKVGVHSSLALDANGRPHISYYDENGKQVKYAHYNGTSWEIKVVGSATMYAMDHTSLALDSNGRPHIAYYHSEWHEVRYARPIGAGWQIETLDIGYGGGGVSLALDAADRPHIAYTAYTNLHYSRFNGTTWETEVVDATFGWSASAVLALDAAGRPHIGYVQLAGVDPAELRYAYRDGGTWHMEAVDDDMSADSGQECDMALDAAGRAHISHNDAQHNQSYARRLASDMVVLDPVTGGTFIYTDPQNNPTTIQVPPGAVSQATSLLYQPLEEVTAPGGFAFANHAFKLEVYRSGNHLPGFTFLQPVVVTVRYSDDDVWAMNEATLRLYYLDGSTWIDAATTCSPPSTYVRDLAMNALTVGICHLSAFAVHGEVQRFWLPLVTRN